MRGGSISPAETFAHRAILNGVRFLARLSEDAVMKRNLYAEVSTRSRQVEAWAPASILLPRNVVMEAAQRTELDSDYKSVGFGRSAEI